MINPTQKLKSQALLTLAYHDFEKGLNSRAFLKIHNHSIGEELVQETFMKTWAYLVKGGKIDMMKAFLYHILNHLIIDEYRKKKTISLDIILEKGFVEPNLELPYPKLINILDGGKAILLIGSLPFEYQKILKMRFIQDLSLEEISLITGKPKKTISVQIHRGLEKLKVLYQKN